MNQNIMKPEKPFEFPKSLLNQIDECSAGGFLLFVINQQGQVEPFVGFGSEVAARSIISYSEDFSKAFREANVQGLLDSMSEQLEEGDEDFTD